ncbi:tail fiber domain-containing protein [Dyadobacter jiangsuensis]
MKQLVTHLSGYFKTATTPMPLSSKAFPRRPKVIFVILLSVSLLLLFKPQSANAQAPQQFSFQGVARDATGKILANKNITVGFLIHQGSSNGPQVFGEQHNVTTNANGIFSLSIGSLTSLSGINWETNSYFLHTAIFYDGLQAAIDLGTTQLLSVPYSLNALNATSATKSIASDTALVAKKWIDDEPIVQTGANGLGSSLPSVSNGNMLIWYPKNAAFRVGVNTGNNWNQATMGVASFATGTGTLASGQNSASFGNGTQATGLGAFSIGNSSTASGDYSLATGNNSTASGLTSTAIGKNAEALSTNSIAAGLDSKATAAGSIAIGNSAQSSATDAVAIGNNSKASGTTAIAVGYGSEATGSFSVSFGNSTASGLRSFAAGEGALAKAVGGIAIGTYNNSGDFPGGQPAPTDRLFQLGHGTSADRSNAITVLRNGNVGIGNNTLTPEFILDIGGRARVKNTGGSNTAGIYFNDSQNQTEGFVGMKSDDEVGFFIANSWRLIVHKGGTVYAQSYQNFSDKRLKTAIQPVQNSLVNLRKIQGYNYFWKDPKASRDLQTGVVAQELEKYFPELVSTGKDGYKAVNYIGLIPHLIEAVKDLDKKTEEIAALKKELASIQELNKKLSALEASVKELLAGQATTSTQTTK